MDKSALTHINSGVGGDPVLGEKNQVTRANAVTRYRLAPGLEPGDGSRRRHPGPALVNMADQTAAVKAGLRCVAAIAIRRTNEAHGIKGDVIGLLRREPGRNVHGRERGKPRPGRGRRAAATKHQGQCHEHARNAVIVVNVQASKPPIQHGSQDSTRLPRRRAIKPWICCAGNGNVEELYSKSGGNQAVPKGPSITVARQVEILETIQPWR